MQEILLPRTDGGVYLQAVLVFPALVTALVLVRRDRDWRLLVAGVLVMTVALFGVRTLH